MSKQPLVTAYIPTRNRNGPLQEALHSVLKQTWPSMEVVVVDDASDDETPRLLQKMAKDHPITVLRNPSLRGAAACRNLAIEHASGEFVAGLDDDDIWLPQRIEKLMQGFDNAYSAVCSYDKMIFNNKEITWKKKKEISLQDLLYYNRVGNQILTKKAFIIDVGGYDESLASAQDYDLWIRLAQKFGPIKCVPEILQIVTMQDEKTRISTSEKKMDGYLTCFEKHKHLMDEQQKIYQRYRLKLAAGESVSWLEMLKSIPFHLLRKEITRKLFL